MVFYVSVWTLQAAVDSSGVLLGMWSAGTLAYTLIATIVRLSMARLCPCWKVVLPVRQEVSNPGLEMSF